MVVCDDHLQEVHDHVLEAVLTRSGRMGGADPLENHLNACTLGNGEVQRLNVQGHQGHIWVGREVQAFQYLDNLLRISHKRPDIFQVGVSSLHRCPDNFSVGPDEQETMGLIL